MPNKFVFDDFNDYWSYAKHLTRSQKKILFKSLSVPQRKALDDSYSKDGWSDLFNRNEVDEEIDELKEVYGYDILKIRARALTGKSVYVPTRFWKIVEEKMSHYQPEVVSFVIDGLKAFPCESNKNVCLIIHDKYDTSG